MNKNKFSEEDDVTPKRSGKRSTRATTIKSFEEIPSDTDKTPMKIKENFDWTEKQKEFLKKAIERETKIMFVKGPAGTSKTLLATLVGLKCLEQKKVSNIIYVRTAVESGNSKLGFLPGEIDSKVEPYARPFLDKLEELLPSDSIAYLKKNRLFEAIPVNYLRGAHFANKFIIVDEAQNLTKQELVTVVTRMGENSKLFILGDPYQSDLSEGKSGFMSFYKGFESKHKNVFCFEFNKSDIVRSQLLREIIEIIEAIP